MAECQYPVSHLHNTLLRIDPYFSTSFEAGTLTTRPSQLGNGLSWVSIQKYGDSKLITRVLTNPPEMSGRGQHRTLGWSSSCPGWWSAWSPPLPSRGGEVGSCPWARVSPGCPGSSQGAHSTLYRPSSLAPATLNSYNTNKLAFIFKQSRLNLN